MKFKRRLKKKARLSVKLDVLLSNQMLYECNSLKTNCQKTDIVPRLYRVVQYLL